jgi:regulator of RNase E activity RraA
MDNQQLNQAFSTPSTPLIADACLRLHLPLQLAAAGIRPLSIENHIAGQALPVRHYGNVDIFLEAMGTAQAGDILVIDNQGRMDEGCIGDLTVIGDEVVFADADGGLFVPIQQAEKVISTAHTIWQKERQQAQDIQAGKRLREQLQFDEYLARRSADEAYTFRQHLRAIGGAIEE